MTTTLTRRQAAKPQLTPVELFRATILAQLEALQATSIDEYRGIWWLFRQSAIWESLCGRYSSVAAFTLAMSGRFTTQLRHLDMMDSHQREEIQHRLESATIEQTQELIKRDPEFLGWLAQYWARQAQLVKRP